ncbi:MAG TPA: sigma-70 family RNA polymerase sigma factor [Nitrospira sp.]|nr:sigma-70 family RNA polymerase sigma factor [Nitrospira sp.]
MEETKVDRVVRDLIADHDRLDGFLSKAHVERLLEKRQLTVEEGAEVYRQLNALGIGVEDESENPDETEGTSANAADSVDAGVDGSFERLDVRLRGLGSKLLAAEEEVELGRRMELSRRALRELEEGIPRLEEHDRIVERGRNAKETMITANLRLVLHIAKPYVGLSDLSLDDLFQEGVMGLMRAVDKYDHTLGYKFSTYATWWIRQSIMRSLADRGTTIRLPVHAYDDVLRLKRAHKLLGQAHPERRTSMAELADELAWTIDKVHFIQQVAAFVPASLDERINGYDDLTLMEMLVSDLPSPEEHLDQADLARCIDDALSGLKEREGKILRLRFGLRDSGHGATLEEIGQMFGLTRERIRQIEAKALGRLRHPSQGNTLRDFLDS